VHQPKTTPRSHGPGKHCVISQELKQSKADTPDIIIEFPSRLDEVLARPDVKKETDRIKRANLITRHLQEHSAKDQAKIIGALKALKLPDSTEVKSFWICNCISVAKIPKRKIESLTKTKVGSDCSIREAAVMTVKGNSIFGPGKSSSSSSSPPSPPLNNWAMNKIGLEPSVWNSLKAHGEGIVVAAIDSGAYAQHESLVHRMRPQNSGSTSWYDPVGGSPTPIDINGHGTAVLSIMIGDHNSVGVAPRATWIACRHTDQRQAQEQHTLACAQWVANENPNIVCNSYGALRYGHVEQSYVNVIRTWDALNIHHVFAQGNSGPHCGTGETPADLPIAYSVGSINVQDEPAISSSRGPSLVPGGGIKPHLSAPGENVGVASNTAPNAYMLNSGTSFAAPYVAGVMALILSSHEVTRGSMGTDITVSDMRNFINHHLRQPAVPLDPLVRTRSCYSLPFGADTNAAYGHGILNVRNMNMLFNAVAPQPMQGVTYTI